MMLTVEREFALAIYALYGFDCLHWLKPGQFALIRRFSGGWRIHACRDDSYTLLGRMPVIVNPMDFRPSYLVGELEQVAGVEANVHDLTPDAGILTVFSAIGAVNLLLFLPLLLLSGYLPAFWRITVSIALITQLVLVYELFIQSAVWRRERPSDFWPQFVSTLLNPLAALRSGDTLLKGMFDVGRTSQSDTRHPPGSPRHP